MFGIINRCFEFLIYELFIDQEYMQIKSMICWLKVSQNISSMGVFRHWLVRKLRNQAHHFVSFSASICNKCNFSRSVSGVWMPCQAYIELGVAKVTLFETKPDNFYYTVTMYTVLSMPFHTSYRDFFLSLLIAMLKYYLLSFPTVMKAKTC